jgi:hypothetical protein
MKTLNALLIIALAATAVISCKKESTTYSTVSIKLKDTPATYEEVNVEVIEVMIHTTSDGWISFNVADSIYDLLTLQGNANAALGSMQIPTGKVSQVRLVLGTQNTVKVNNVVYPLSLSSQDESGLKLNIHEDLMANTSYTLVIDFDAQQSVHDNGNGTYKLKPVLSASFN